MEHLVIYNIGLLATPLGTTPRGGAEQGAVSYTKNAWVEIQDGIITATGTGQAPACDNALDAGGCLVTPGLIDAHTHLVFGGWREHELAMKRQGVPYLEILAQGGGILSTVRATRAATEEELTEKGAGILEKMLALGVTTCEAKSGYGLDRDTELKQLRVIRALKDMQPVELAATYLGAHAVPTEYKENRREYIDLMVKELIPQIAGEGLAEFCDVFCETGVFTPEESRQILAAGQACGLKAKIHADEIDALGGSTLAGELGAISAEHLIAADEAGITSMAKGGTVAVLLPATSLYLGKPYAPARAMIQAGVPVAAASDFNPGSCPSFNMQLVMNLACWGYKLTPGEVLTAVTLNAAAAIDRADRLGSVEAGKQADLVLWNTDNLEYLFYRFGENLVKQVIKRGKAVK